MKNLKTFEDYSDLDKQDKERAERNQISNFPHSAKEDTKKREKREKRSRKEDPDGMYPRDDERYDDSNDSRGGWQDGMGKPSWLGESVAEDYLDELRYKNAISSDVYEITREEEDLSAFKGTDKEIKKSLLKHLNYIGGISSDVYQTELEELSGNHYRDLPDMTYKPKNHQDLTDEDGMPW